MSLGCNRSYSVVPNQLSYHKISERDYRTILTDDSLRTSDIVSDTNNTRALSQLTIIMKPLAA